MLLAGTNKRARFDQPQNHIDLFQSAFGNGHHIFAQFIFRLMNTRCVQKYDLPLIARIDSLDPIARCLWFVGGDRDLLSDQPIHQR